MSRGRSAAELQPNGCRARIRTWTNRGNSFGALPSYTTRQWRRESESNAHAGSSPTSVFETVTPANGRSLHVCAMRVGPDGIEPPTASMWTRRSAAELWTNDRGTGDAVPRRRCALDHQALRTGWPPRNRWHARKDSNLRRNPVLEAGALPLSYARLAGEIGIEPMASCASGRRSTHS